MEMDELPVGGGATKAGTIDDEFGTNQMNQAEATGSLEEKLLNKNWSVRAQCFDELTQLFKGAQSEKDQVFKDHCGMWKKYLSDANPGALEKCLDSLNAFIDMGDPKVVVISQNDVITSLIERCVGHAKPTIRQKGLECFNLMFEVTENFDDSVEVMVECLKAKNIKMGEAAQKTLNSWLGNFGAKKIKLKPFMTLVENNANSTNPSIRTEAMNFYKECYKWLGEGLKPLIETLKKQQKEDLDKAFEEIKDKPKTIRYTRSEKKAMKDQMIDGIIKQEQDDQMASSAAYDLAEAITLLTKYNPEWQDKILDMKKWNEKKELLDQLITESNAPKLETGDYADLIKTLKKLIGDPNQVVSHLAIKACGNLAKGLRQDFGDANCKELIATLIGKFKEKKTQIIDEVHIVLDHFVNCTNLEVLAYDITAAILDKAPTVKKNICAYLERIAQVTYIDVLQRSSPELISALMKTTDDQMGDVRDAALSVLGIFKGRLGEATMSKYLSDLLPQKAAKVNESANNVKPSKYDKPEKVIHKQVAPPPLTKKAAPKGKPEEKIKKGTSSEESKKEETKKPFKRQDSQQEQQQQQMQEDVVMESYDEQPIGGGNKNAQPSEYPADDDRPIVKKKPPVGFDEDVPIGGGNRGGDVQMEDELPVGGKSSAYDLDRLIAEQEAAMMANAKPKTGGGPPARLKAQAKKEPVEEEKQMNFGGGNEDEDAMMMSPKAQSKPPPKPKVVAKESAPKTATAKTTTAKAGSGSGAAAGGVQIQEEDLGSGLSKEEAEAKVNEVFSPESVAKIEEAKWQDKVEGLKLIEEQIVELQPGQDVIEALAKYVKMKLKDWKESNVNIVKGAISLFTVVAKNCDKINKRAIACIMPFLSEKLGDVKVMQSVHELCVMLTELIGPKFMGLQIIKHASNAKSPKIIEQSNNLLTSLSNDFGVTQLPMKEMIAYGQLSLNNPNPAVRTSAMAMFASMYKQAGEMVKNFLKDVKESTMKVLDEEFEKVTPYKKGEFKATRIVKGQEEAQVVAGKDGKKGAAPSDGFDDMMPREDISKQINPKLIALFKSENWKERIKASEEVEKMLRAANMRIQPVGLNELMDNIKQRMTDPNKAVLRAYIQLEVLVVEALGANSKQFIKKILPPLMSCFADKNSLVRGDVNKTVDKWAENIGAELVMNHLFPLLMQENPELRTEALTWIIKYKDAIKLTEIKELPKPLVACLQDRTPSIRSLTEKIILEVMPIAGYNAFQMVMKDLKPATQNTLKPQLEKIKNSCGASVQGQDVNNGSLGLQKPNSEVIQPKEETKEPAPQKQLQGKPKPTTSQMNLPSGQNTATNKDSVPTKSTFEQAAMKKSLNNTGSKQSNRGDSKEPTKQRGNTLGESIKQFQQPEVQQEQLTVTLGLKDRRAELDRRNKWQTEDVKGDLLEKLKSACSQAMGAGVSAKMFSTDFKLHSECIDLFQNCVQNTPDQFTEVLDLIFKWSQVKLAESSNTQFAIKVFDFYAMLFKVLEEGQYAMLDFEALVIIPLLCDKSGINNAVLKEKVKKLIKMLFSIYDNHKCYAGIITFGLNSKNMKVQSECLDEIEEFIKINGVNYTTDKDLKLVAKLADSNDKFIRENSLKVLGEVYKHLENDIWRLIGDVTPKVQGLIEQRFKKVKVVAPNMGLAGSGSSSNLFQPESQLSSQNDKGSPRQAKTSSSGFGLKKLGTQTNIDNSKKTITPRGGTGLTFSNKPPQGTSTTKMDNSQLNNSNSTFSKSINKFNTSNRSNDEGGVNQPQSQQATTFSSKANQMKKFQSSVDHDIGSFNKNMIPKTTRPETSNSDFNRLSGNDPQNQQNTGYQKQLSGIKQNQPKNQMREQFIDEYEVDDLMILTNEPDLIDTELERQVEEIIKHIQQLKHGDLSKRVDSLVSLNEMISQVQTETFKAALVRTSNELINAFTHVLMDIFERPVEEIPLRFAKYFITIVLKACSCKEIMREASEESIFELAEQLLTRLLIDGLDKVGENKEGELILKNLNSSMLRLLENCNHTYIFCVLFNLLRKYKDFHKMPKLPGLIIKCLLKLSKILEKLIEKLDMEKILLAIHEYLVVINHDNKTQNDEMGIRIVKTVTNELVKLKRDSIWEAYRVIQCHSQQDNHIYRWIQIILKSLQGQGPSNNMGSSQAFSTSGSQGMSMGNQDQEIMSIIEELRNSEQFEAAVPKLYNYLETNPQVDLNEYLKECSKTFQDFIRKNLDKYRALMKEENKHSTSGGLMMNSLKTTGESDTSHQNQDYDQKSGSMSTSNRVIEYQSKIQGLKNRFNQKGADNSASRDQMHQQQEQSQQYQQQQEKIVPSAQLSLQHQSQSQSTQQNLNTSLSDMNSRLTQKWSQITKKTNAPNNASHMSNTMGGFGGGSQQVHGLEKANVNLNQSSLGNGGGQNENEQQNMQGASNSDLNKRLAEMKAKLQALKKK